MSDTLPGLEGRIHVQLRLKAGRVADVTVTSTRRVQACRVLEGRGLEEVPRLVSLLFSVCRNAQVQAAQTACEQAMGQAPDPAGWVRRELQVLAETLHEHCRMVLVDWPFLLGEEPDVAGFARVRAALHDIRRVLTADENVVVDRAVSDTLKAFGTVVRECLALDADVLGDEAALRTWAHARRGPTARSLHRVLEMGLGGFGRSDVAPLPPIDPGDLDAALNADWAGELAARPHWQGRVYETGPLARMHDHPLLTGALLERYGNGLLTRLAARLLELLALPQRMCNLLNLPDLEREIHQSGCGNGTGIGLGVVEAARGRLVHRVEAVDGKVVRYQILAPTEWNFHPEGALTRGLLHSDAGDVEMFRRNLSLLVAALDPCVAYDVTVQ